MEHFFFKKRDKGEVDTVRLLRRFSSIKVDYEKERRKTITTYQQQGLQVSIVTSQFFTDKKEVRRQLRASVERYSLPELYVKMICALFPQMKSRDMPDSNALIQHLRHVFRLSDYEHGRLMDVARMTKLPQRIINLEIVEARNIPAKDPNGLSDPFCVVFVNTRDIAQRTKVMPKTLNPVWKQYFTFKVNDLARDILHVEIMDFNEQDEPLRDRIRRFKEVKSPGTLGILLKEIANARSVQELIGAVKIPASEISSETIEKWFKLKNSEDKGEIYIRIALGYNKSKEAASEEFLQIVHFLLVYELEKDSSLGTPFYWDEHFEVWSKYILRQFKWQGGLKPKDIVLAKWRAYTAVNSIFPLNANMMCLLMDAVLERALNCEYDTREVTRFWDCTVQLVDTIMKFITELHDVLPCPVTVLHTYHMLKSLELLNQYLLQPATCDRGKVPFTKDEISERVVKAVRDGANKFYLKVFADSTYETIQPDQDPLHLALERLIKMGQILHEDVRLGVTTIHTDFKGILNVDYLTITYQVYDEQYGKMVKYIVEEYNSNLFDYSDSETENDDFDENSLSVKLGLSVLKLYLSVKNLTSLAPPNYLDIQLSEFSLKRGVHDWFFHSVATWIDILRKRVIKLVKNSVSIMGRNQPDLNADATDTILNKIDNQNAKDVPISPSAVDTAQLFLEINKFWTSLGWENPHQSYAIVRKILEELYGALIFYATQLLKAIKSEKFPREDTPDSTAIQASLRKGCIEINNINYVKEYVEILAQQLNITEIIEKIDLSEARAEKNGNYEESIDVIRNQMQVEVQHVVAEIIKSCVKIVLPNFQSLLHELSKDDNSNIRRASSNVIYYIDNCLVTMKENLENQNFRQLLCKFWEDVIAGVFEKVNTGLETGKSSDHFPRFADLLHQLYTLFWPRDERDANLQTQIDSPSLLESYEELKRKLSYLQSTILDLKSQYYANRHKRQRSTSTQNNEHGIITIRTCFVESECHLIVEILNARKLKSYNSNHLSNPYAMATVVPKESFPTAPSFSTKGHKETLFPLFEETFTFTISEEDRKQGYLQIILFDYEMFGRDVFMGEVFVPLIDASKLSNASEMESLPQLHLPLCKPKKCDIEYLHMFEERLWDKDSVKFAKLEKERLEDD